MNCRDLFTDYDEEEIIRFETYLTSLSSSEIEDLYDHLIQLSIDEDLKINDTILKSRVSIKGRNRVEFSGTGEYSSQESSTYLDIYLDNILLGELIYDIGQAFASECVVLSLEFIEEENALAKLSERVQNYKVSPPEGYVIDSSSGYRYESLNNAGWSDQEMISYGYLVRKTDNTNTLIKQENKSMATMNNTLREVTITLIDNNINLEDDQRVVFQKKGVCTSFTNEETKMNTIASGEVMEALKKHNEDVRFKTTNGDILDRTGRDVSLKAIKLLSDTDLEWRIVETA